MNDYYEQIKLKSWKEFKELVENARLEWIFRGQSNANWELQTTLERSEIVENFPEFEDELLTDFKAGVKFYVDKEQPPITTLEHFSLLQHFGAPSRLLDFTKSPYIAAYFAFEEIDKESDLIAVWVVNKIHLYQRAVYYFQEKIDYSLKRTNYTFDDETFANAYEESKKGKFNCIFPVEPQNRNQRYHLQQSIFVAQGNPFEPLVNQLEFINSDILKSTFMKVTIPISERKIALRDLMKMNINRASLFPGLDGFAKSLLIKYRNLMTFAESAELLQYAKSKNMA